MKSYLKTPFHLELALQEWGNAYWVYSFGMCKKPNFYISVDSLNINI